MRGMMYRLISKFEKDSHDYRVLSCKYISSHDVQPSNSYSSKKCSRIVVESRIP